MSRDFAKSLRANMTDAERRLWYRLRAHRLEGIKFKRQVPIGRYVADFACMDRKLLVEVDGGQHAESMRDHIRDVSLAEMGYRVLRFSNEDILRNDNGVAKPARPEAEARGHLPPP